MLHGGRQEEPGYGLRVSPRRMPVHHAVFLQHMLQGLGIQRQVPISSKLKWPAPLENWRWPGPHGGSRQRIPLWLAKDEARTSLAGGAEWGGGGCIYGAVCEAAAGRIGFGEVGYLHCWRRIQEEGRMEAAGVASLASTSSGNAPSR